MARLRVLDLAEQLSIDCNDASSKFPPHEQNRLADQLRRAASSAALNIAEGITRTSYKDRLRFLETARGSLKEVETVLRISRGSRYINEELYRRLDALRDEVARMVYGLIRSANRSIEGGELRRNMS